MWTPRTPGVRPSALTGSMLSATVPALAGLLVELGLTASLGSSPGPLRMERSYSSEGTRTDPCCP